MGLSKEDARTAVEVGALAIGALQVAFPRLAARLYGVDPREDGTVPAMRAVGARNLGFGTLLLHVDDADEEERFLLTAAATASFDCLNALSAAVHGRIGWRGALTQLATTGTVAGMASYALTA